MKVGAHHSCDQWAVGSRGTEVVAPPLNAAISSRIRLLMLARVMGLKVRGVVWVVCGTSVPWKHTKRKPAR